MINDGDLSPSKKVTFSSQLKTDSPINKGKKNPKIKFIFINTSSK